MKKLFRSVKNFVISKTNQAINFFDYFRILVLTEHREKRVFYLLNFNSNFTKTDIKAEKEWIDYWNPICKNPGSWAYRLFSNLCGHDKRILSQTLTLELERCLNPQELLPYYTNKNLFDRILSPDVFPATILRKLNGIYLDKSYNPIKEHIDQDLINTYLQDYDRVIIKPTVDSNSGEGVMLFVKENDEWEYYSDKNLKLTPSFLNEYSANFIIQDAVKQHHFMSNFNPTSVNTIRVATYFSSSSCQVHPLYAIIRMGAKGSFVDNMHADGKMVGVNVTSGKLFDYCLNTDGQRFTEYNGFNFSHSEIYVPGWNEIVKFTTDIARKLFPL